MATSPERPGGTPPDKVWVRDLAPGRLVDSTFAVARKDRRRARNGSPFLAVELADRTGRVRGTIFDDVPLLDTRFEQGDTVRVLGTVEEYRGRAQLLIRAIERVEPGDPLAYVPGARRDTEDLDGFLEFLAAEIADSTLRALVEALLADGRFRPRFAGAPAGVDGHHAYAGGALEHTVAVATICREIAQLHPGLDESVLGAAALTFCLGAADAFPPGPTIQLSEEGRLLGVAHLSARRVEHAAARLRSPRDRVVLVLHAIESSRPRTPEASCLQAAILLDAGVQEALDVKRRAAGPVGGPARG
jgi:3'-5' exoribonuclease